MKCPLPNPPLGGEGDARPEHLSYIVENKIDNLYQSSKTDLWFIKRSMIVPSEKSYKLIPCIIQVKGLPLLQGEGRGEVILLSQKCIERVALRGEGGVGS